MESIQLHTFQLTFADVYRADSIAHAIQWATNRIPRMIYIENESAAADVIERFCLASEPRMNPGDVSVIVLQTGRVGRGLNHFVGWEWSREIEWSNASNVGLDSPTIAEAVEFPVVAAEIIASAIAHHSDLSDLATMRRVVLAIRKAADALAAIDVDQLPEKNPPPVATSRKSPEPKRSPEPDHGCFILTDRN